MSALSSTVGVPLGVAELGMEKHPQLVTRSKVLGVRSIEKNRRVSLLEDGSSDLKKENSPDFSKQRGKQHGETESVRLVH